MKQTMPSEIPMLIAAELEQYTNDCDCACSVAPNQLSTEYTCQSHMVMVPNLHLEKLTRDYWLCFSPYAPGGPCVINDAALRRLRQFEGDGRSPQFPVDYEFLSQSLIAPNGNLALPQQDRPDTLAAWLHITNACNLECPYCYVRKSSARMSEATGFKAIDRLIGTAATRRIPRLKLKYAGGEALLHFRLVRILHEYIHQSLADKDVDMDVDEVVLSNGVYLTPDVADWLAASGVRLMISLDGVGAQHDRQRPQRNGRPSFNLIERNIGDVLLKRGIVPHVSVTVTALNTEGIADTIAWILERELPFSINFYRSHDMSLGRQELQFEEGAIIAGMRSAYDVIERRLPTRPFINGLLDKVNSFAHTKTCGASHNYLVIGHEGHVNQCQMHVTSRTTDEWSANQTIHDSTDMITLIQSGKLQNLDVDEKDGCRDCSWRYRCTGGCPVQSFQATGRWNVKSPNCNIYTTLYPEVLRLEGLRLLKANGLYDGHPQTR